jgi:hypothetical protein
LQGKTLKLSPGTHNSSLTWNCSPGSAGEGVDGKYLPSNCRGGDVNNNKWGGKTFGAGRSFMWGQDAPFFCLGPRFI